MKQVSAARLALLLGVPVVVVILVLIGIVIYFRCYYRFGSLQVVTQQLPRTDFHKAWQDTEMIFEGMKAGRIPWRRTDVSSVGYPQKEEELLAMDRSVDAFLLQFGQLPRSTGELFQKRRSLSLAEGRDLESHGYYEQCWIAVLGSDSYLLNCDGLRPLNLRELQTLVSGFEPGIERFLVVEGHVVLHVPPFVRDVPLQSPEQQKTE